MIRWKYSELTISERDIVVRTQGVLVYHKVDQRLEWGLTRVTPDQFERQIRNLARAGKRVTTLSGWFDHPEDESLVAITFDDAYESVFRYAFPILEKYDGKSTLFVISDYIGRLNSWDVNYGWRRFRHMSARQLQMMASSGHEIASHTRTHRSLPGLPREVIWDELWSSRRVLESLVSQPVRFVAYPFAKYDQQVLELTRDAGYLAGCGLMRLPHSVRRNGIPVICRQGVYRHDTVLDVRAKVSSGPGFHWQSFKQNLINWAAGGSVFIKHLTDNSSWESGR